MSFPIRGHSKNRFCVSKVNNTTKEKNLSLLNYFPSHTKPSNLKNKNLFKSSSTVLTSSKKQQTRNLFKVISPVLHSIIIDNNNNHNDSKKMEIVKINDNSVNDNDISENDNSNISLSSEESSIGLKEIPHVDPKKLSEQELKDKLMNYFRGKKIYIEIYNGKENASNTFLEILLEYKIIQCKRLTKNIDYIIFKEGHLKTKKYALMNNIKMVNPLWVDDKIRNIFKDDKEYFVENNMGDILLHEKLGKNETMEKNYENELEAEFDVEYANMIDKQRENDNKIKEDKKEDINQNKIGREKRKSRLKTEFLFLSGKESEPKNMVIEDFLETNNSSNNIVNNENKIEQNNIHIIEEKKDKEEKEIKDKIDEKEKIEENIKIEENEIIEENEKIEDEIKIEEDIKSEEDIKIEEDKKIEEKEEKKEKKEKEEKEEIVKKIEKENENNIPNNLIKPKPEKYIPFKIEKVKKNNNNINENKNAPRSKTPDKISKPRKRIRTKEYKHKATSKKIMVTKIQEMLDLNKIPKIEENSNILSNIPVNNNNSNNINKENQNLISNYFTPISKIKPDPKNKDKIKDRDIIDKSAPQKNNTLGQKINIITYKLEEKEIQCLTSMDKFEYKGDLKNSLFDYRNLYSSASVIILDKEKCKYDWKMYEFFVDKKILVDFASFLFEFMTEKESEDIIDAQNTLDKLNKISINEESYFLNKKIRYQRRSLLHSINIIENISDHKKEKEDNEGNKKMFNFVLYKNIVGGEKRILHKLLKFYLKAYVIKVEPKVKRSQSVGPGMKFKFKTEIRNNNNNNGRKNIFLIHKINEIKNKMEIEEKNNNDHNDHNNNNDNDNKEEDDDELTIDDKNDKDVEGDTFLISKEKIINRGFFKIIPNFKEVISFKYVFDSFWAGELINLNEDNILKKYQFI